MPWRPPTHQPIPWRPPSRDRYKPGNGYYQTADWRAKRARVLRRDHYACQIRLPGCWGYATIADHIQPREEGGGDEETNLRGCCPACHNRRHPEKGRSPR